MSSHKIVDCLFFNKDNLRWLSNTFYLNTSHESTVGVDLVYFRPIVNNFNKIDPAEDIDSEDVSKLQSGNIDNYTLYKNEVQTKLNFMFLKKIFLENNKEYVVQDTYNETEIKIDNHIKNASLNFYKSQNGPKIERFIAPNLEESEIYFKGDYWTKAYIKEIEVGFNNKISVTGTKDLESIKAKNVDLSINVDVEVLLRILKSENLTYKNLHIEDNIWISRDSYKFEKPLKINATDSIEIKNLERLTFETKIFLEAPTISTRDLSADQDALFLNCKKLETYKPGSYIAEIKGITEWNIYMGNTRNNGFYTHVQNFEPSTDVVKITKTGNNRICELYFENVVSPNGKTIRFEKTPQVHIFYKDKEIRGDVLYV